MKQTTFSPRRHHNTATFMMAIQLGPGRDRGQIPRHTSIIVVGRMATPHRPGKGCAASRWYHHQFESNRLRITREWRANTFFVLSWSTGHMVGYLRRQRVQASLVGERTATSPPPIVTTPIRTTIITTSTKWALFHQNRPRVQSKPPS